MNTGATIGLISAVPFESSVIIDAIKRAKRPASAITKGTLNNHTVIHITSGMGAVNAAHAATVLIERYKPSKIVLFGIGGAYPSSGLSVGDVAAATEERYADTGIALKDRFMGIEEVGFPLLRVGRKTYFDAFPIDRRLLKALLKDGDIRPGVFLTVSQITGSDERARRLAKQHGAICENMEGAAVAHVCAMYGVPMLELRGISNMVEARDVSKWRKEEASENVQRALIRFLA